MERQTIKLNLGDIEIKQYDEKAIYLTTKVYGRMCGMRIVHTGSGFELEVDDSVVIKKQPNHALSITPKWD